ncbi:hypothetical protein [Gemmatimonas sp.]|uniref:hypothetical protein n=1 Tax=Gemmatimonas sp. TaxID=1962908 RepID=UPI00333F6B66
MCDARVYAVIHYGREVGNVVLSRHAVPSAVDVTALDPLPGIGWRYDADTGAFSPPPPFSRPEGDVKRDAIAEVNRRAGDCRARHMTVIPGQDSTYILKADELKAHDAAVAAGAPIVPTDYPILNAEAVASRATLAETATIVRTTRDLWIQLAAAVEGLRRGAIVAIEGATTEADVLAAIPDTWP